MGSDTAAGTTPSPLVGASVWMQDLYEHLISHVERERGVLQEYLQLAAGTESKAFSYVVGMLAEDELRHHRLFEALAESLRAEAGLGREDPAVPYLDLHAADTKKLRELTMRMLRSEREDARELKRLHGALRDVKDTTLWDLLVEIMRHDTEKHMMMLRFLARHARPLL